MHRTVREHSRKIAIAGVGSIAGGWIAGALADSTSWAIACGFMLLVASITGYEGIRRLLGRPQREPSNPNIPASAQPTFAAQSAVRQVNISAGQIDMKGAVVAAGDVHQMRRTNINFGGVVALIVAGLMLSVGVAGTAAFSTTKDTPNESAANPESSGTNTPSASTPSPLATTLPPAQPLCISLDIFDGLVRNTFGYSPPRVTAIDLSKAKPVCTTGYAAATDIVVTFDDGKTQTYLFILRRGGQALYQLDGWGIQRYQSVEPGDEPMLCLWVSEYGADLAKPFCNPTIP